MYNIAIYFLVALCRIVSLFNKKISTMCRGQKDTWHKLSLLDKEKKTFWFHCASLGEFEQARNLIETIKNNDPNSQILLTFFSPSGYEVRKDYKYADVVTYLPFDTKHNAKRFVRLVNPSMVFFVKYEFWWNYIICLKDYPLYSVSLILRKNHYLLKPLSFWFRKQLKNFNMFFVQDKATSEILNNIGYTNNLIVGDTRLDRVYSMSKEKKDFPLIRQFIGSKKVFLAGSSWPEDEKIIQKALKDIKDIKIILAPHLIDKKHISFLLDLFDNSIALSNLNESNYKDYNVLIIDNIGMLMYLYSLCTLAYIGGGFGEGIHNVLEAAVFNKPLAFGPNNKKFKEAQDLIRINVGKEINNSEELQRWTTDLLTNENKYKELSSLAGTYVQQNIGATEKILQNIFRK